MEIWGFRARKPAAKKENEIDTGVALAEKIFLLVQFSTAQYLTFSVCLSYKPAGAPLT